MNEYHFDNGSVNMIPPPNNNQAAVPTPTSTKRPLDAYIKKVRKYLRDYKAKNQLLVDEDGNSIEENTNEDIMNAIEFVYFDAVQCPPVRMNIPLSHMSHKLWFLWGVVAFLLDSDALDNARNALAVQDGGVGIDPETYKAGIYSSIAANLAVKYENGLRAEKVRYNLENFFGGQGYGTNPPSSAYGRWYGGYGLYY